MKKTVHLVLPNLLAESYHDPKIQFPHCLKLLSRAKSEPAKAHSLESYLLKLFGLSEQTLPVGALGAYFYDVSSKDNTHWFCQMDPIQSQADAHTAFMVRCLNKTFDDKSENEILSLLGTILPADFKLHRTADAWYLSLPRTYDLTANALWEVLGKAMHLRLPSGPDAATFKRLTTEFEMLIQYEGFNEKHPNKSIEQLNGVWFWGFGGLPNKVQTSFDLICSNEPAVKGLAKLANIRHTDIPEKFSPDLSANHILIVDTRLLYAAQQSEFEQLENLKKHYELNCFKPLIQGLEQAEVNEVVCYIGGDKCYQLTRRQLKYFWRRMKTSQELA